MGLPRIEMAVGPVDGVNTTFYTPTVPYAQLSVQLYLNGQLLRKISLIEDDPATGKVILDEAPRVGDIVQLFYIDDSLNPSALALSGVTCRLIGRVLATSALSARVLSDVLLRGSITDETLLSGSIHLDRLRGDLRDEQTLRGRFIPCGTS